MEAALKRAMSEAGIHAGDVCFVNAHGTATPDNDKIEGSVFRRIFGGEIKFLSSKGFTGHTLGAAGGLEAAFTAAALREGWIPGSAGFVHEDDEILLSPVREPTPITGRFAISTSLAFGGNNAAIVISRGATDAERRAESEQRVNVAGIGVVFARGRGIGSLEEALRTGWVAPSRKPVASSPEKMIPVYSVEEKTITDKAVLKKMRRADRFSKMAVLAAWDAVKDGGIEIDEGGASLGIILATAFGPQVTAFRFLDEIIDHGDASVSPTLFSHSVHNAAASYVASALGNHGPTLTVTQFGWSFHQALILARAWIHEGRCENVLVGSVEECGTVMEYICSKKLEIAEDGRIRPFEFSPSPSAVPGEGSVFLLLTGEQRRRELLRTSRCIPR